MKTFEKDEERKASRAMKRSEVKPSLSLTLLIVDENASLANLLRQELEAESYRVETLLDGETALSALRQRRFDLAILELSLPGLDGLELIRRIRPERPRMPILVLASRCQVEDKVQALQSGADDFLSKPFSFAELLARVQALLRRHSGVVPNMSEVGDLRLYREEHRVERNGRRIDLTPREFSILECMLRHAGRPVSRATLFEEVWNAPHNPSSNIVDVYMKYVRDKVDGPGERKLTHTIRGFGYELRDT